MKSDLNHNSIVPLYAQLIEKLQADIHAGRFNRTKKLPTEEELSQEYGVSRITIRRAVDLMVQSGLVEKKQGKGTFVSSPKIYRSIDVPMSFTELCAANGLIASAKILEASILVPQISEVREQLHLKTDEQAVHIKRIRYAGDNPLAYEDTYYPLEFAYLLSIDLEHDSTYRYLQEEKGIQLRRSGSRISIIRADATLSKLLMVPKNSPQLDMKGVIIRDDGDPVHTSHTIGYGEHFELFIP